MIHLETNKKRGYILLAISVFLVISASFMKFGVAEEEDDEDDDDKAKDLGVAAFGLFGISLIYPFFFQIQRLTMKLNKDKERNNKIKKGYQKFMKVVRKPLQWIHYLAGLSAIVLLGIHGIGMLPEDNEQALLGIITGSFLLFYVLSGIILKVILPKIKKVTKLKKALFAIHRSLILIIIVLGIHLAHVAD
jgi:hypothetical protein